MCKKQTNQKPDAVGVAVEPKVRMPVFTLNEVQKITDTANSAKKLLFKNYNFKSECREITTGDVDLIITTIFEQFKSRHMPINIVENILKGIYSELAEKRHEARTIENIRKIFEIELEPHGIKIFKN